MLKRTQIMLTFVAVAALAASAQALTTFNNGLVNVIDDANHSSVSVLDSPSGEPTATINLLFVPLPSAAWMGLAFLGIMGAVGIMRRCSHQAASD